MRTIRTAAGLGDRHPYKGSLPECANHQFLCFCCVYEGITRRHQPTLIGPISPGRSTHTDRGTEHKLRASARKLRAPECKFRAPGPKLRTHLGPVGDKSLNHHGLCMAALPANPSDRSDRPDNAEFFHPVPQRIGVNTQPLGGTVTAADTPSGLAQRLDDTDPFEVS